jgi:GalNAc5-diNAcBac-PP-undecaprenol beta-1,3-glucosyltransferase
MDLVSIVIATYNRAHFIEEALDSILKQSYENWECIIIDDGSTDNTKEILNPYLLHDSRINYYERGSEHLKGLPGCRNQGLDLANGDYIVFFDDDDIVHPDNLKTCVNLIKDQDLLFCRYDKKTFHGRFNLSSFKPEKDYSIRIVNRNDLDNIVNGRLPFASCTVLWKKVCFDGHRFNEKLMYAEEWECYIRILSTGIKGISIDKVLYFNRKHANSNTGEFHNFNSLRRASNLIAINLVIGILSRKELLSPDIERYFIRTGFSLKEISVVKEVLHHSQASVFKKLKYLLGFRIYPVLQPLFNLKAKLKNY